MNRYRRLLEDTAVFTAGKFISKLIVLLMVRLYTDCLSPAEFSRADLIVQTANLLIPLAALGVGEGIFRSAAARAGDREAFLTNGLFALLFGSAGFLLLTPLLELVPTCKGAARLIAPYVVASNLHTVVSQYLCAAGRTRLFAAQGILNTVLTVGFGVLFLPVLRLGADGYVLAIILSDLLTTVFLTLRTRLWRSVRPRTLSRGVLRSLLSFSLPLVPTTVCWWVIGVSDRYMVSAMCSPEANGLYAVAYKVPALLSYAVGIFDGAWRLSVAREADDEAVCRDFYSRVWRAYTTVAFLCGAAVILGSRTAAAVLFAPAFRGAWAYIPVLTAASVFAALDTFLGSVYFARKRTLWSMATAMTGAGLNLLLNFLLIPPFGAAGASAATLASYLAVCAFRLLTARRLIAFRLEVPRGILNTLLLGVLAAAVTLTSRSALLWIPAAAAAAGLLACNARAALSLARGAGRAFSPRKEEP